MITWLIVGFFRSDDKLLPLVIGSYENNKMIL